MPKIGQNWGTYTFEMGNTEKYSDSSLRENAFFGVV